MFSIEILSIFIKNLRIDWNYCERVIDNVYHLENLSFTVITHLLSIVLQQNGKQRPSIF